MRAPGPQPYPRIPEGEKFADLLDERHVVPHRHRISHDKLRKIIIEAIRNANRKSSRAILEIPNKTSDTNLAEGANEFRMALPIHGSRLRCPNPSTRRLGVLFSFGEDKNTLHKPTSRSKAGWRVGAVTPS
jgi:hypothetical protein